MNTPKPDYKYSFGGTLRVEDRTYVTRQADRDFYEGLKAGEFCYVLNSRQMGKSSLRVRTMARLKSEGIACAAIDITAIIDNGTTEEKWYAGIIRELVDSFELSNGFNLGTWWRERSSFSCVQRFSEFIETVLLAQSDRNFVIFLDEIDSILKLKSAADNFFAYIRSCWNKRADRPEYRRLTFAILGVAEPSDLIQDRQRTPFNIGRAIELNGFTLDKAQPLIDGLRSKAENPQVLLQEILKWTGGQPFLTQKVCQLVIESSPNLTIEQIIKKNIIDNWRSQDVPEHLKTIEARILSNKEKSRNLLEQYKEIISSSSGIDTDRSQEQQELKLSGLVVKRKGKLQPYNLIYREIFNLEWVELELSNICPYEQQLNDWLDKGQPDTLLLDSALLDKAISWKKYKQQINPAVIIEGAVFLDRSEAQRTDRQLKQTKLSLDRTKLDLQEKNRELEQTRVSLDSNRVNLEERGQELENAKFELNKRERRINRISKVAQIFFAIGAILLFFLSLTGYYLYNSERINNFDSLSNTIMTQSEFSPISSLKNAIENADDYDKYQKSFFPKRSTSSPYLALQKLFDNSQEKEELNTFQQGVNSIDFSLDNLILIGGHNGTAYAWQKLKNQKQKIVDLNDSGVKINSIYSFKDSLEKRSTITFVTGSSDGRIILWEWSLDKSKADQIAWTSIEEPDHKTEDSIQVVRLTKDKKYIFSLGEKDGLLKKWKIKGKNIEIEKVVNVPAHEGGGMSLKFNYKADLIGTGGNDKTVKIWDFNLKLIKTLTGYSKAVNSIHFCPSSKCTYDIVAGSSDGTVKLWSVNGEKRGTINAGVGEIRGVRFSPDGNLLATSSAKDPTINNGSSIRIWNLEDKNFNLVNEFKGHQGGIESIRFHEKFNDPNNPIRELASSGSEDSVIRIWDVPKIKDKHQEKINSVRFDGDLTTNFITAGSDGKVGWWSLKQSIPKLEVFYPKSEKNKKVELNEFTTVRILPKTNKQNRIAAVGDSNGHVKILSILDKEIKELGQFDTEMGKLESMDWKPRYKSDKPNSYLLAVTGNQGEHFQIWNISINEKLSVEQSIKTPELKDYTHLIVRFSQDGKNLLFGGDRGKVILIKDVENLPKKLEPQELKWPKGKEVESRVTVGFNPDQKSFTIVSREGEIWQSNMDLKLSNQNPTKTYQSGTENIAINSKSGHIATAGAGAAVRLWDIEGHELADFRSYWGTINSVNFSKDGKYLLTGGDDGIPRIWKVDRQIPDLIKQANKFLNLKTKE
jgi:WD40 repeat protein